MKQACRIHGGPVSMVGAAMGVRLSRMPIPRAFRKRVFTTMFGKKYDPLTDAELEKPLTEFRSINELFTRGMPNHLRPVDIAAEQKFVSPCDCTVQEVGRLQDDTILTVKDIPYRLSSLAPESDTDRFRDGHFAILFLSPRDCHRIFSPQTGTLEAITHVPGYRLLVHPAFQKKEFPTFTLNERLIMELTTELGRCLLIMVAGWGVGHITHPFPTGLKPNGRRVTRVELSPPKHVEAADWLATFELGSTVVLITEPNDHMRAVRSADEKLNYGECLFELRQDINTEI